MENLILSSSLFDEQYKIAQKERERMFIRELLSVRNGSLTTIKMSSNNQLEELSEAMYDKTKNIIPNHLEGALEGKAEKASQTFLSDMNKSTLQTAVKG